MTDALLRHLLSYLGNDTQLVLRRENSSARQNPPLGDWQPNRLALASTP